MSTPAFLRESLDTIKKSASGGQPSDPFQAQYWEMAGAHALLINGLLSVYEVRAGMLSRKGVSRRAFCSKPRQ